MESGGQSVENSAEQNHLERLGFRFNTNATPFIPKSQPEEERHQGINSTDRKTDRPTRQPEDTRQEISQNAQGRLREGNANLQTRRDVLAQSTRPVNRQIQEQPNAENLPPRKQRQRHPVTKPPPASSSNQRSDLQPPSTEGISNNVEPKKRNRPKKKDKPNNNTGIQEQSSEGTTTHNAALPNRQTPRTNPRGGRGKATPGSYGRQNDHGMNSSRTSFEDASLPKSSDSGNRRQLPNARGKPAIPNRGHPNQSNGGVDRRRRRSDNFGPDVSLRDRLTLQLERDGYECTICSNIIRTHHRIWSCNQCYHLLHLACAKRWASTDGEERPDISWRCPTCNSMNQRFPDTYFCFCGKTKDPPANRDELPHSCGGTCGKNRGPTCTHPCTDVCHPGPCSECPVQVTRKCACGLTEMAVRCGTALQRKCDTVCNKQLNCGIHVCQSICHAGACEPCRVGVVTSCHCGGKEEEQFCGREATFSCNNKCKGVYDCGVHNCKRLCHSKVAGSPNGCGSCPDSPERIINCSCGKTSIKSLLKGGQRATCSDPIPTCKAVCGKILHCQSKGVHHRCQSLCHNGECPPCSLKTELNCKCQRSTKSVPCKEFMPDEVFECDRVCKKVKSCGLHKCQKKCCQEDQHICMQICDKMLNCGKHRCERLCHPGQCSPCTHASFDEEFCLCRRTVYYPPIKCGDQLAECTYPCRREHACNHEVTHNCHREENCPPCMVLTSKMCAGGHETRKNIPCHLETISCGRPCGKALRCGIHECDKRCHRGECEKDDEICKRPCPQPRSDCEHKCGLPCHRNSQCPASDCKEKMTVLCECGRRKEALRCVDVLKNVERLRAIRAEEEENRNATAAGPIKILRRSASMDRLNSLPCDSECNRVARIKSMAEALDIQVDDNGDQLQCAPITYSEYLRYVMKNQADFLMLIEKAFVDLVRRVNEDLGDNGICHNFKPMRIEARRAVHEYAVYFGLSSESVDSGAQRSVVVTGKKCSARIPTVTLSAYAARFPKKLLQTGPINISSECVNAMINVKAPTLTSEEPQMKPLETKLKAVRRRPPPTLQTTVVPISIANAFSALAEEDEEQHEKKTSTFDPFADEPIAKSHESEKGAFTPESSLVCTESFGAPNAPDSWEDGEQEVSSDVEQKVPPDASLE